MKKLFAVLLLTVILGSAFAQDSTIVGNWKFSGIFPDTAGGKINNEMYFLKRGIHGLAVDPDGKIWIQPYYATDSIAVYIPGTNDLVGGKKQLTRVLYCFNPDGTQASFSPIFHVTTTGGVVDTLGGTLIVDKGAWTWSGNTGRGLGLDKDGNILASYFDQVIRIDYKTGQGIDKVKPVSGASLTACWGTNDGIFTAHVVGGNPLKLYDNEMNFQKDVLEATKGFSRSFAVREINGETYIFWAGYSNRRIIIYKYGGLFGSTDSVATIENVSSESFAWQPETNWLWVGSGSKTDMPNQSDSNEVYRYRPSVWYAFDVSDPLHPVLKDSIAWFTMKRNPLEDVRPRGMGFSPDGKTAYVCIFNTDRPCVEKHVFVGEALGTDDKATKINGYMLGQNYPNPFNPTTKIGFTIPKAGHVTLKVYNMLGQEVATLVDKYMNAGTDIVNFNATNLPSGTYIYQLKSGSVTITKKMMLVK
ncbi:MAG TPA: T9SS type A sorting domain-containing protein [Ignavibacteriales bacterium]|nr:T9SS type A sorting domain-containing protein [Ignavibacteriales bacterium]